MPVLACVVSGVLGGCSGPAQIYDRPSSHFDFPNSNVKVVAGPINEVAASSVSFFSSDVGDPDMEQKAVSSILEKYKGDLIINVRYQWTSRMYPIFLPIFSTELRIVGAVARIEYGHQPESETRDNKYR